MLLFALLHAELEALLLLIGVPLLSQSPCRLLYRLSLFREGLLGLGAHRGPFQLLRRVALAALRVSGHFWPVGLFSANKRELLPAAHDELQDFLIGWFRAENDPRNAEAAVFDMLDDPYPELAVMKEGQGGRHADLHGDSSFVFLKPCRERTTKEAGY